MLLSSASTASPRVFKPGIVCRVSSLKTAFSFASRQSFESILVLIY